MSPNGPSGSAISERRFHAWLRSMLWAGRHGPLPLGDDAAAIPLGDGRVVVLTSDALVEGGHFVRDSPPAAVGRAATAVSLSDAAAKGARPSAVLIDLLVPRGTPERWARAVLVGAEREAIRFGCHVVGGDTKASTVRTVVSMVAALGRVDTLAPRDRAAIGDLIVTTGTVGRGGSNMWRYAHGVGPRRTNLRALLDIRPRVAEGILLGRYAHAVLDTSDGIAESAHLLAEASTVRVVLDVDRLPLDPQLKRLGQSPRATERIAYFGGDYELLAALPPARWPLVQRAFKTIGAPLTIVGRIERGRGAVRAVGTDCSSLPHAGWDGFRRPPRRGDQATRAEPSPSSR